jgi:hypothetical protein
VEVTERTVGRSGFGYRHIDGESLLGELRATGEKGALAVNHDRPAVEDEVL